MSDANRVGVRYAKNSERNVPITISPVNQLKSLRITGTPNLAFAPESIASNEIRADRQLSGLILVGAEAGGDVGFELSPGTFDDLIESAMFSTWVNTPRKIGVSEVVSVGAGTATVDSATDFTVNHVVFVENLSGSDIGDALYYISGIATNTLTLVPLDGNTTAIAGTETVVANTAIRVVGLREATPGDIDIDVTGTVITINSAAAFFTNAMGAANNLDAGQFVKISGMPTAGNNVWLRIVNAGTAALTGLAPSTAVTETNSGAPVIIWFGDYVRNGADAVSAHSYAIERRYEDQTSVLRELFLGMVTGQMTVNLVPKQIATGTLTFQGFNSTADTVPANLYSGGTPADVEALQFDQYNSATDVGVIAVGADAVTAQGFNYVLEATINVNNNLRQRNAVGVFGAVSIGTGEFSVTGNLNTYFDNKTYLDFVISNNDTSYTTALQSPDGRSMLFDLPRIKFGTGAPEGITKNADVTLNLGYTALRDPVLGYTMHTQRFHATQ